MRQKKVRIAAEELVEFFQSKPVFDKSQTNASLLYGWASTRGGLYTISDIYKYFEAKGFNHDAVTDVIDDYFQKQSCYGREQPLEKGKTHSIYLLGVMNHNPEYKQTFVYYYYDISQEEARKLKKEYEDESLRLMANQIERRKLVKKQQQANRPKQGPKQSNEEVKQEVVEKKERKQRASKPQRPKAVKIVVIDPILPELTIES